MAKKHCFELATEISQNPSAKLDVFINLCVLKSFCVEKVMLSCFQNCMVYKSSVNGSFAMLYYVEVHLCNFLNIFGVCILCK